MALRGSTALTALKDERHGRWRKLIRNDKFRQEFNGLCDEYAKWVKGPPLEVTVYEDEDYFAGDLDRKDVFLGTYRIVDHDEDLFLLEWGAFKARHEVAIPAQVLEQIRLGEFPRLEPCPAQTWDALGNETDVLPPPIICLGEGLQDIPVGATAFIVGPYQQGLVIEALKKHLPKQKTRSRRDKLDAQLREHDSSVRNGRKLTRGSTRKSKLEAAKKATGNQSTEIPEAPDDLKQDIRDALAQLPGEEREAIRDVIYLQYKTIEQYAASTKQSVAQVTALINSGLSKLRPLLEDYEGRQDDDDTEDYAYAHNVDARYSMLAPGCKRTPRRVPDRSFDSE